MRQAGPYIYNYPFTVGEAVQDERTQILVRRLLDSHVMTSCQPVLAYPPRSFTARPALPHPHDPCWLQSPGKGARQSIGGPQAVLSGQAH